MKKCPFCAEEIQEEAIKCKHCGEFLDGRPRETAKPEIKWYFRTYYIVLIYLCIPPVGFLVLPLVWMNPHYSRTKKIVMSVILIVLNWYIYQGSVWLYGQLKTVLDSFQSIYNM